MILGKLDKDVLKNLALWLGVSVQKLIDLGEVMPGVPESHFEGFLNCQVITWKEGQIRRATHKIVKYLRESNRYYILDSIKKIRTLQRKKIVELAHCRFSELDAVLREKLSVEPIDWRGHRAVLCLTHDLDCAEDYELSRWVYGLNKKYNLRSSFNFLTNWGYDPDPDWLQELHEDGFEVGLHGLTHDIAIGTRPPYRIKKELSLALEKLDFPVRGYRAPAFAVTPQLLKVIKELGIVYDSSMKTYSAYGKAVETFYPYRFPGVGIWEIPLTIQDDRVFRDMNLSNEEGLGVIKEMSQRIINLNGVVLINNHPRLIKERIYYYEELLKWISELENVWVCTPGELIDFMEERERQMEVVETPQERELCTKTVK